MQKDTNSQENAVFQAKLYFSVLIMMWTKK